MRSFLAFPLLAMSLVACSSDPDDAITWRLPCGGTATTQGQASWDYRYEHDDRGNTTLNEVTDLTTGMLYSRFVATYDGEVLVSLDYERDGALDYQVRNEVANGRLVKSVRTDFATEQIDTSYTVLFTWDHGDLVETVMDWVSPDLTDMTERYERTAGGHASNACSPEQVCDRWEYEGPARYVGDFARYTSMTGDYSSDGTLDYRYQVSFDSHFLTLVTDDFVADDTGTLTPSYHSDTTREPDGTALRTVSGYADDPASQTTLDYRFECAAARLAPTGGKRGRLPEAPSRHRLHDLLVK